MKEKEKTIRKNVAAAVYAFALSHSGGVRKKGCYIIVGDLEGECTCTGWEREFPPAKQFEPGVYIVTDMNRIFRTIGGNADTGSETFVDAIEQLELEEIASGAESAECPYCNRPLGNNGIDGACSFECAMKLREDPRDTGREERENSKAVSVEISGDGTDSLESPLPIPTQYKERFQAWLKNRFSERFIDDASKVVMFEAFMAGVDAKADSVTVRALEADLAAMEAKSTTAA